MSIQALREERTAYVREYRNILDSTSGALSDEQRKRLDEIEQSISAVEDRIAREQRALELAAQQVAAERVQEAAQRSGREIFAKWLRNGDRGLTSEDWFQVRNAMSTTTPAEGGYTVDSEVASTLIEALKEYGGMREAATVIRTASGNPMSWPTTDNTAVLGEILAENAAASNADPSFGTKALPVYKYSSKVVTVPIELLQDTSIDMEGFIVRQLAERLGRITNLHFTTGSGTSQPTGLLTAADVGVTGAATNAVTYAELVDLEHSVDPAYRRNAKWMFADSTLKALKKLVDSQNRPLWLPGVAVREPDTFLGYQYVVNQDVPGLAANAKAIAFGDLSKYVIRDVMSITYYRFDDSAFAKSGQVGFLAFLRSGGNYMDVGGAVKLFKCAAA
jgi:HK97 family phage major capsid protein